MVSLSSEGQIFVHAVNYEMKKVLMVHKIQLRDRGNDHLFQCLGVCDQSKLILAGSNNKMFMLKLEAHTLTEQVQRLGVQAADDANFSTDSSASNNFAGQFGSIEDLECYGYVGNHVLWVGMEYDDCRGFVRIYDYDLEKNELRELEDKKVMNYEYYPIKILKFGNNFYYTGMDGGFHKISILLVIIEEMDL